MNTQTLSHLDGTLELTEHFIPPDEAATLFEHLRDQLDWRQEQIKMFGKSVPVPRLVCWYGDPGAVYTYSGTRHDPLPWTLLLSELRARVEQHTHHMFNSVLGNLYRDGNDSMGWHADKEKELGPEPCIASLSFGAARLFRAQHSKTRQIVDTMLNSGSLLVMRGTFQKYWRHCVPKSRDTTGPRINLTFRRIVSP